MGSGGGEPANLLGLSPEEISAVYARDTAGEGQRFNMGAQVINALTGERSADLEALKFGETQAQNAITNQYNRDVLAVDKAYKEGQITDKQAQDQIDLLKLRNQELKDAASHEIAVKNAASRAKSADAALITANKDKIAKPTEAAKKTALTLRDELFNITHSYDNKNKKFTGPKKGKDINILDIEALDATAKNYGYNIGYIRLPEMKTRFGDSMGDKEARLLPFSYKEGETPNEKQWKQILISDYGYSDKEADEHLKLWAESLRMK